MLIMKILHNYKEKFVATFLEVNYQEKTKGPLKENEGYSYETITRV